MTRRGFLAIVAGLTGASAGAALVVRTVGTARIVRNLGRLERLEGLGRDAAARLRNHYAWLAMDPAAVDSYLADYQHFFGPVGRFSIPRPDFYTKFLLSTNFFSGAAARLPNRPPVVYTSFYEPGASPCYNPLAQRPPSDAELTADRRYQTLLASGTRSPR